MNTLKSKKHLWISLAIILAITLVLGWFVGRYLPGVPQDPQPDMLAIAEASIPHGTLTSIAVESVEDIAPGSIMRVEGITRGEKYTAKEINVVSAYDWRTKEVTVFAEAIEIEPDPESEWYDIEYPPFEIAVNDAKVLTYESFVDWYPDFESYPTGGSMRPGSKFVLVETTVTNLSETQSLDLGDVQLWSDDLVQIYPDHMGNSYSLSWDALKCINGLPVFQEAGEVVDMSWLTVLEPGETRTMTFPYQVFREAFTDGAAFDELDLSRFSLDIYDYDPATVYRFHLG